MQPSIIAITMNGATELILSQRYPPKIAEGTANKLNALILIAVILDLLDSVTSSHSWTVQATPVASLIPERALIDEKKQFS